MRMMLVNKVPAFTFRCIKCGNKYHTIHDSHLFHQVYADLDGKAFKDYYCEVCKNLLPSQHTQDIVIDGNKLIGRYSV